MDPRDGDLRMQYVLHPVFSSQAGLIPKSLPVLRLLAFLLLLLLELFVLQVLIEEAVEFVHPEVGDDFPELVHLDVETGKLLMHLGRFLVGFFRHRLDFLSVAAATTDAISDNIGGFCKKYGNAFVIEILNLAAGSPVTRFNTAPSIFKAKFWC